VILFLPIARYSGAAYVFPALSRRHKGENEFYAKVSVVEFDVILYSISFCLKKKIEDVVSSILSWLRTVVDSLPSFSFGDAVNQDMPLNLSYPFCCVL